MDGRRFSILDFCGSLALRISFKREDRFSSRAKNLDIISEPGTPWALTVRYSETPVGRAARGKRRKVTHAPKLKIENGWTMMAGCCVLHSHTPSHQFCASHHHTHKRPADIETKKKKKKPFFAL